MKPLLKKHKSWQDHYTRKAKSEQYPARSVYKLKEIQQKYHLIKKGFKVLDLGCAPGSWLLYAAKQVGQKGKVVGVDLMSVSVELPDNVHVHTGDIQTFSENEFADNGFNVILSDMAPATTGNKNVDSARSFDLCQTALAIVNDKLLPGGSFVCKIFQGEDFQAFSNDIKRCFNQQRIFKPKSSRKASKEIYIIGMDKK